MACTNIMTRRLIVVAIVIIGLTFGYFTLAEKSRVQGEIDTIARLLDKHPEMVIDLTKESGEYCLNTWTVGGSHMTHYATEPTKTTEDVIDFVKADSFSGSINLDALPLLPKELGAMEPDKWYHLPAGSYDPHHNMTFPFALLVRATNVE